MKWATRVCLWLYEAGKETTTQRSNAPQEVAEAWGLAYKDKIFISIRDAIS